MLRRVTGVLFEGDLGPNDVELAVEAQNVAVEFARFEYDGVNVSSGTIEGHPACKFKLVPGVRQFEAMVDFGTGAPPSARYDLLQMNDAGSLVPVGEGVDNDPTKTPIIGFGIDGVLPPARARRAKRRKPARRAKRAGAGRKTGAAKKTGAARKAKAATARKSARPKAKRATKSKSTARKRTARRARKGR